MRFWDWNFETKLLIWLCHEDCIFNPCNPIEAYSAGVTPQTANLRIKCREEIFLLYSMMSLPFFTLSPSVFSISLSLSLSFPPLSLLYNCCYSLLIVFIYSTNFYWASIIFWALFSLQVIQWHTKHKKTLYTSGFKTIHLIR